MKGNSLSMIKFTEELYHRREMERIIEKFLKNLSEEERKSMNLKDIVSYEKINH